MVLFGASYPPFIEIFILWETVDGASLFVNCLLIAWLPRSAENGNFATSNFIDRKTIKTGKMAHINLFGIKMPINSHRENSHTIGGGWFGVSFICLSAGAVEWGSSWFAITLMHHVPPKRISVLVLFVIFGGLC